MAAEVNCLLGSYSVIKLLKVLLSVPPRCFAALIGLLIDYFPAECEFDV